MIEIFNENRSKSLGCFKNFKAAKVSLNGLATSGEPGESPSLVIDSYKNDELRQRYTATYSAYFNKWSVEELPLVCAPKKVGGKRKKMQRKKHRYKVYKTPVMCFKEGFPDWMNRTYQPV